MDIEHELTGTGRSKKTRLIAILAAFLVIAAVVILPLLTKAKDEEEPIFREYPVSRGDIVTGLEGKGSITADGTPHNFSDIVTLEEIYVKPGAEVKKGDKLAKLSETAIDDELDDLNEQLQKKNIALSEAQNGKKQAENKIGEANNARQENSNQKTALSGEISRIKQQIKAAKTEASAIEEQLAGIEDIPENAEQIESLKGELAAKQASIAKMENTLGEKEAAYAALETAGAAIGTPDTDMTGYDNAIKLAQMDVNDVAEQIKKLKELKCDPYLYAQEGGTVLEVNGAVNTKTSHETPVVVIAAPQDLYAKIMVPQSDIAEVKPGQKVEFTLDAYPGMKFTGTVISRELVAQQSGSSVAYGVLIALDGVDEEIISGMTLSAKLVTKELKNVVQVANKAITLRDGKQYVMLKDEDGAFYEQEVTTGFSDGRVSEVLSGLEPGDVAYVEG